jgi:hypothetical protein
MFTGTFRGRETIDVKGTAMLKITDDPVVWDRPEQFMVTADPQDAVFEVSSGWTGGMGEAVLEPGTQTIKEIGGIPVYIKTGEIERLLETQLSTSMGPPRIRISARITVEKRRKRHPSIRGHPRRTFYEVTVHDLHRVYLHP